MPSRREIAFRAVAVFLGVAIPFGIVEGISGWIVSRDNARYRAEMPADVRAQLNDEDHHTPTTPDPFLGYRMVPNLAGERVQTNEYGLREGPISERPEPGVVRILFLGGSVAWGYQSHSNDDTVPAYLEAALTRRAAEVPALQGRRVEVLNAAVPAYVTWQEALLYAIDLHRLGASWIVSLDGTNDIAAAIINGRAGVPMRYRLTERAYLDAVPRPGEALWRWILESARELRAVKAAERLRPAPVAKLTPVAPAEVAAQLREAIAFLDRSAQSSGARLLTVLQPMAILPGTKPLTDFERQIVIEHEHRMPGRNAYYAESYAAMRGSLAGLARERAGAFHWLDATDAFAHTAEGVYSDHCHLTPLGHRTLAERIADGWIAAAAREGDAYREAVPAPM
jgi:lysophospholipase L1-like esterase